MALEVPEGHEAKDRGLKISRAADKSTASREGNKRIAAGSNRDE